MLNDNQTNKTITWYNNNAKQWAKDKGPEKASFWTPEVTEFQRLVPQGNIFEIGFGGAREAATFINKPEYTYTGIEPAQKLVEIAQQNFNRGTFLAYNAYNFDLPEKSFDALWCSAVLLHVPHDKLAHVLKKTKHVLKKGAIGFISLLEGSGTHLDKKTNRSFYLYEKRNLEKTFKANGFNILKSNHKVHPTHPAWLKHWLTFFIQLN